MLDVQSYQLGGFGRGTHDLSHHDDGTRRLVERVMHSGYRAWRPSVLERPICCMDDRTGGGLPGGLLSVAIIAAASIGGKLSHVLTFLMKLDIPLFAHHDCRALEVGVGVVRRLADPNDPLYELYRRCGYGEVDEQTRRLVAAIAGRIDPGFVDLGEEELFTRVREYAKGRVTRPDCPHHISGALVDDDDGHMFVGGDEVAALTGGARPLVIDAAASRQYARLFTREPDMITAAALVPVLLGLEVVTLFGSEQCQITVAR